MDGAVNLMEGLRSRHAPDMALSAVAEQLPAPLSRIISDICSKASAQLPACKLVMLPGWPDAASRTK